jgi:hypothetical protein
MFTDEELAETIKWLESPNVADRAVTLKSLWVWPSGDERLLPYLERLLEDKTPCVVGIPVRYGEVCWLAAHALAAEYKALGRHDVVRLSGVVKPIHEEPLGELAQEAHITYNKDPGGLISAFAELRRQNKLPLCDLEL